MRAGNLGHKFRLSLLLVLLFLMYCLRAQAAIEVHEFKDDTQRQRYESFIQEMRCPKCQNQNLAGSDSPISADLRRELDELIKQGKSDKEIVDYMVARYGDFILYRPRVTPVTYILWFTPLALVAIAIIVLLIILRQRRRLAVADKGRRLTEEEQTRLDRLLNDTPNNFHEQEPRS